MTRLLLRADASGTIGIGHLARVVAFAEEAAGRGWDVSFSGLTENADFLVSRLDELGVRRLPPTEQVAGYDAMLVDHYSLGELRKDVNRAGARLVSVEDGGFGRRSADIVVDCGLGLVARADDGSPVVLKGTRYAPLRQAVVRARSERARRKTVDPPPRVLLVLGGGGAWRATVGQLMRALRDTGRPFVADVLAQGEPDVPEPVAGQEFRLSRPDIELPRRLTGADLAVSAAGVTLLELCCIGVPSALVRLVDNQAAGYRAAIERGFGVGLGSAGSLENATPALEHLLTDRPARERMASAASAAVDGRGAARVLDALEGSLG